jgi:hypothetical protein
MADGLLIVRNIDAAEPQRAACFQAMRVVADPNAMRVGMRGRALIAKRAATDRAISPSAVKCLRAGL